MRRTNAFVNFFVEKVSTNTGAANGTALVVNLQLAILEVN